MRMKILSVLMLLLVSVLAATAVSAVPGILTQVKLDGNVVSDSATNFVRGFEKGDKMDVNVQIVSNEDIASVQIEAMIRGYDHDDLMEDITDVFDMKANVTYVKSLEIPLRERMDQGRYKLRILIFDKDGETLGNDYELEVAAPRHNVMIRDVVLSPSEKVSAGKAVVAKVRVKNYGAKDEDGVKVTVSIPSLGVSDSDYIDVLEAEGKDEDSATSEELFLRIPQSTKSGVYTVKAVVVYDDGDEEVSYTTSLDVVGCDAAPETCGAVPAASAESDKTVIAVSAEAQSIIAGQAGAVYPVTITNTGSSDRTYVLSATAPWAAVRFAPSNVAIVKAGETRTVQVYVAANEGVSGKQVFVVSVQDAAGNSLKDIALNADVAAAEKFSFGGAKRALEIALVVLVVLLVLVGLIAAFNKLKGGGEEEETQTYY